MDLEKGRTGESLDVRKRQCKTVKLENIKRQRLESESVGAGEENEPFFILA